MPEEQPNPVALPTIQPVSENRMVVRPDPQDDPFWKAVQGGRPEYAPKPEPGALPIPPIPPTPEQRAQSSEEFWRTAGYPAATPAPPGEMSPEEKAKWEAAPWTDVAKQAYWAIPESAGKVFGGLYHAVTSPKETAQALGQVGSGLYSKGKGLAGYLTGTEVERNPEAEAAVDAIAREYANKYFSLAGFKKTLATDPFSIGMDVSMPLSFYGAMPVKGAALARAAATAMDPVQAAMGAAKLAKNISYTAAQPISGVGYELMKMIEETGANRSPEFGRMFSQYQRGQGDLSEIVQNLRQAVQEKKNAANSHYRTTMEGLRADVEPMDISNLLKAIQDERAKITVGGLRRPGTFDSQNRALDSAIDTINQYRLGNMQNVEALDTLKRSLRAASEEVGDSGSRRMLERLSAVTGDVIKTQKPEYHRLMEHWQKHLDNLAVWEKDLGASSKTTTTSALAKMLRRTKTPEGLSIIQDLSNTTQAGKYLPAQIAGAATSETIPDVAHQMINAQLAGNIGREHGWIGNLAQAVGASPRLMGQYAYNLGRIQKQLTPFGPSNLPYRHYVPYYGSYADDAIARQYMEDTGQASGSRPQRASGGKVSENDIHEQLVGRLMNLAEKAKKTTQKSTEPLLDAPDEAIVHALKVADSVI